MSKASIRASAYCLSHVPELALWYGNTPYSERHAHPDSEFLKQLGNHVQSYDQAIRYTPNLVYIGAMEPQDLASRQQPWFVNLEANRTRSGKYGEIMPEDEFLGLMDICDVFDLIWLEKGFAASVRARLEKHPLITEAMLKRLEAGHDVPEIQAVVEKEDALPFYFEGRIAGCCRRGHETDHNLSSYELLVNLACKAGGVLSLLHLMKNANLKPEDIDFVVECSEEAAGDVSQRGGGNFAKAIAEIAGCVNASGCDVRAFCAGPVNALIVAASMVAAGARKNVAVVGGGAIPKLYMNARDHVKKDIPALENCLGGFGVLLGEDNGEYPVMRLDCIGKHNVGAGASPQAVTSALVLEPLQKAGLSFADVDNYAAELHNPEITLPAGAGNVPESNYKMIAALAVMKNMLEKTAMQSFIAEKGMLGFAHTQGHIPSGVPFIGHAVDAIAAGKMNRVMIIGKGSLFLARLTNLADGASFLIERSTGPATGGIDKADVKAVLLEALTEVADELEKGEGK